MIEMTPALLWFILVTLGSTYLIAFAYKNTKFILKHKVCVFLSVCVYREFKSLKYFRLLLKEKKQCPEKLLRSTQTIRKLARKKRMKSTKITYNITYINYI